MGSAPTKPRRRDGIYFAATEPSSPEQSDDDERPNQVRKFKFENVTKNSFLIVWVPPEDSNITKYLLRIFPPEEVKSKTLVLLDNSLEESTSYSFDRLTPGTRYTVGIVAIDENDKRSRCTSAIESTLPEPPTDIEFPSKESSATAFRVKWQASKGNRDYYEAEISPIDGVTGKTTVSNLTDPECVFTGLVPGTEYTAKVVSVANERRSDVLEDSNITNPGHVYDLSFPNVTHNEFQVIWKPPPGNVECYTLELTDEKESGDPIIISKIKQKNYKFNGLVTGRNYLCKIFTHALGKTSVRKIFEQCTIPAEVPNLSVQRITVDQSTIAWSSAPGDAEDYDLFLSPKEGVKCDPCPNGVASTMHTFTGLVPGTKYTVGIVTNSKDKTSQRVVTGFMTDPAPCGEISFPSSEIKSTKIGVHWIPSRGEVDSYSILTMQEGGTGGSWKTHDIKEPRYYFTQLTPGAEYTFSITALREGRHSESQSATCSTLPCPAGVIAFPEGGTTPNQIKVSWNPSAGGVDMYKIVAVGGGTNFEDYAKYDVTEYTISNLQPGTTYEVSVSAVSWGVESEPSIATRTTGPDKITDLDTETLSKNELRVYWKPPSRGNVEAYDLAVRPADGVDSDTDPKGVKGTEYTFTRLVPGTLYSVTVVARDSLGICGFEVSAEGYTLPGDILNLHFPTDCVKVDSVKAVWGVEGNSKDVLVKLSSVGTSDGQGTDVAPVLLEKFLSTNEYLFTGLQEGITYRVSLQAVASSKLATVGGDKSMGAETVATQATLSTIKPISTEKQAEAVTETPTVIESAAKETPLLEEDPPAVEDTLSVKEAPTVIEAFSAAEPSPEDLTTESSPKETPLTVVSAAKTVQSGEISTIEKHTEENSSAPSPESPLPKEPPLLEVPLVEEVSLLEEPPGPETPSKEHSPQAESSPADVGPPKEEPAAAEEVIHLQPENQEQ